MNGNNNSPTANTPTQGGKRKRKFNVIDFFILLLIAALIISLVYAFSPWSQIKKLWSTDEITFQYAVEIKNVDSKFVQSIKNQNGYNVTNAVSKNDLGIVTEVDTSQKSYKVHYQEDDNGELVGVPIMLENQYDITVYITTTAVYEVGKGYTVNGDRIAVGEELHLRFPSLQLEQVGYCVSIVTDS